MSLDVTYGNIDQVAADKMDAAVSYPHPSLPHAHEPGCTEPWIAELVCALLKASGQTNVLETGGFSGTTSAWLAHTLKQMGGGTLTVCEIDADRAALIHQRAPDAAVIHGDALAYISSTPPQSIGFVFLDDDHSMAHVAREIYLLLPKMKSGGIICFHDVYGQCDLQRLVRQHGGYALNLPRLGPAGGLGLIQVP